MIMDPSVCFFFFLKDYLFWLNTQRFDYIVIDMFFFFKVSDLLNTDQQLSCGFKHAGALHRSFIGPLWEPDWRCERWEILWVSFYRIFKWEVTMAKALKKIGKVSSGFLTLESRGWAVQRTVVRCSLLRTVWKQHETVQGLFSHIWQKHSLEVREENLSLVFILCFVKWLLAEAQGMLIFKNALVTVASRSETPLLLLLGLCLFFPFLQKCFVFCVILQWWRYFLSAACYHTWPKLRTGCRSFSDWSTSSTYRHSHRSCFIYTLSHFHRNSWGWMSVVL